MVSFPLLLIPLAIYNIVVWLMPGVSLADPLVKLTLVSGAEWTITLSDILLALSVVLLLLEVIKGARPGAKYLTDHLLSFVVFGAAAAEFVLWPKFGTSTYFLLTLLALVEFLSGVTLHTRRAAPAASRRVATPAEPAVVEPAPTATPVPHATSVAESAPAASRRVATPAEPAVVEPAPTATPVPQAAPVAESAPPDHFEPKPAAEPGPSIMSPDLQPSSGSSASSEKP